MIFPDDASAENFLREYLEQQLTHPGDNHPDLRLLRNEEVFCRLRASLSIEWLKSFRELALNPLETLFDIAAQCGNRDDLKGIIADHCAYYMSHGISLTEGVDIEQMRTFWVLRAWWFLDNVSKEYWDWLKSDKDNVFVLCERYRRRKNRDCLNWPELTSSKVEDILNAFIDEWPKVDPPSTGGITIEEKAYGFLTDVIWSINSDDPDDAFPVLRRLLADQRLVDLHNGLKHIYSSQLKKKALRDFEPPTPQEIVNLLDRDEVVTVEGLRQLVIQELQDFQKAIDGGEYNSAHHFYEKGDRLDEVRSTEIIAERLNLRLEPQGVSVILEHQVKGAKRSDFTVAKIIGGKRRLLVAEVKGQWHRELYTAASTQLHEYYAKHSDAEQQGIYLAIWFGKDEEVAGRKRHVIGSAQDLKCRIEAKLPPELTGLIDVFVLDVSNPP